MYKYLTAKQLGQAHYLAFFENWTGCPNQTLPSVMSKAASQIRHFSALYILQFWIVVSLMGIGI
jgi:hypothetical protein